MTDTLQLAEVAISKFRRLSEPHTFEIATGPGITVLVGPNGSGKSTVLDAIEWTLTRSASRLPNPATSSSGVPDIFRTLGSEDDPEVSLRFIDHEGAQHSLRSDDAEDRVAALLRRADSPWSIKSVPSALRLTHFSSQRSIAKLGYEDDDSILKDFAAPAGLERMRGLDRRLWGHETRTALKNLEREAGEKVRQYQTALERLNQLEQPGPLGAASGVARRLRELKVTIADELGVSLEGEIDDLETIESRIVTFRSALEAKLGDARALRAMLEDSHALLRRLAIDEEEARRSLDAGTQVAARRLEARDLAKVEQDSHQAALDRMNGARTHLVSALALRAELADMEVSRLATEQRLADLQLQVRDVDDRLARLAELEALTARLRAGLALQDIERNLAEFADESESAALQHTLTEEIEQLTTRREELAKKRDGLEATLSEEAGRLQSLAALAAALAGHLHADDIKCPVCAAEYAPGELLAHARKAIVSPGPAARKITDEMNEVTQELGSVSGMLSVARTRRDAMIATMVARARLEADRKRQWEVFGDGALTAAAIEELESQTLDLREELNVGDETDIRLTRAELDEHKRRLAHLLADVEGQVSAIAESLAARIGEQPVERSETELRAELRGIDAQLDRIATQHRAAAAEYSLALVRADNAEANLRRLGEIDAAASLARKDEQDRADEAARDFAILLGGLSEEDFFRTSLDQSERVGRVLERLAAIRAELAATHQSPAIDDELALLRVTYLPSEKYATPAQLRAAITDELRQAENRQRALGTLAKQLRQRARVRRDIDNRLQGTALKPWNSLFRSVYASLAGSLGETLEWTADRVDMRFNKLESHVRPNVAGAPIPGWLAGHFFSEGQLAALQISAMITASVLLPWSRWRALLLDDPLQHADVIKVGAFADLIRALCSDRGHQIIMTTHDRVQAEFITAKFAARGLAAKVIAFERPLPTRTDDR